MSDNLRQNRLFIIFLMLYAGISTMTLLEFPLIHSDEAWLSGMTNEYIKLKSVFVTESFFDLLPRTSHTMKSLYHMVQIPFVLVLGNTIFTTRFVSLLASLVSLTFFYATLLKLSFNKTTALLLTIILSLNIQFVYASHFGRQEMMLIMVISIGLYLYYKHHTDNPYKCAIHLGLLIGTAIAIHPNAFIIATMFGLLLLLDGIKKPIDLKPVFLFTAIVLFFGLLHLLLTLSTNPTFISEYWEYGKTLEVDSSPFLRFVNFKDYYIKLYQQITGTYYIPPLKNTLLFSFCGSLLLITLSLYLYIKKETTITYTYFLHSPLMLLGYNIGIFIIGRYNTTSISLIIPPCIMMLTYLVQFVTKKYSKTLKPIYLVLGLLILLSLRTLFLEWTLVKENDYNTYLEKIDTHITDDDIILGNLTSSYVFHSNTFYDIRNLAYLDQISLEDYLEERQINTIIYYEEYDYIHRNQQWEILYGDDNLWYDPLNEILNADYEMVDDFTSLYYGNRIIRYSGDYNWTVSIYKKKSH